MRDSNFNNANHTYSKKDNKLFANMMVGNVRYMGKVPYFM